MEGAPECATMSLEGTTVLAYPRRSLQAMAWTAQVRGLQTAGGRSLLHATCITCRSLQASCGTT